MSLAQYPEYPVVSTSQPLYSGQEDRVEELNRRMVERNSTECTLEPNFSPRPVSTKYSHFPVINLRAKSSVPLSSHTNFSVETQFNPGNRAGPVSGFLNNVDRESILRYQAQIPTSQDYGVYVPSSESTLYHTSVVSRPVTQPYPLLFHREPQWQDTTGSFVKEYPEVGAELLNNCTRYQLRGLPPTVSKQH